MISLLIVEDNDFEREALIVCINWELMGIGDLYSASNGNEAYDLILKHNPDIVLTDIKMPHMNGLELLDKVNKSDVRPKFVICSAFEDFSFIKQAMKNGAANYLLKPVNQKELIQTIRDITNNIIDDKLNEEERIHYQQEHVRYIQMAKTNFLKDLILSEYRRKPQDIYLNMSDICLNIHTSYRLVAVEFFIDDEVHMVKRKFHEDLLSSIGDDVMKPHMECFFNEAGILVVLFHSIKDETESMELINRLKNKIVSIPSRTPFHYFVGVSSITTDIADANTLYRECMLMLQKRILLGFDRVEFFMKSDQTDVLSKPGQKCLDKVLKDVVDKTVSGMEIDSAFKSLEEVLKSIYSDSMQGVQSILIKLVNTVQASAKKEYFGGMAPNEPQECDIYRNIINARSIPGAIFYVQQICEKVRDEFIIGSKSKVSKLVDELISIINREYMENITLLYLSKKVFLSSNYIRIIFKEKTGKSITDYLTYTRMEKAKELFTDPVLNISEIGGMVGYPNSSYFCAVFKSVTGFTPSEFRRMKKMERGSD